MQFKQFISSSRKLWAFIEGLYPVVGKVRTGLLGWAKRPFRGRRLSPLVENLKESPRGKAILSLGERYYWRNLAPDRDQLQNLSPATLGILHPVFLAALGLFLLLPLFVLFPWPATMITLSDSAPATGSILSLLLGVITAALGWSCLIAGAGAANRPAFVLTAYLFLFNYGILSFQSTPGKVALAVMVLSASFLAERNLGISGWRDGVKGGVASALVGAAAGILASPALPFYRALGEWRLAFAIVFGAALGLLVHLAARRRHSRETTSGVAKPDLRLTAMVFFLCTLSLDAYLFATRGNDFLSMSLNGVRYIGDLLWPYWYFMGVGIIFKLLKNAQITSSAVQDLLGRRWLKPVAVAFFSLGALAAWSEWLCLESGLAPDSFLSAVTARLYGWFKPVCWNYAPGYGQIVALSLDAMRWVFLAALLAVLWLSIKRRLDDKALGVLLYFVCLGWLLLFEYYFQVVSFSGSGRQRSTLHAMILLLVIFVTLLWLIHTVAMKISRNSSPLWPSRCRMAVFGGVLVLVLTELHLMASLHHFEIINKIFWYLYRGIVDVGVPYFLYVYAGRRFRELPVPAWTLFGAFCSGAVLTIPLSILDKLSLFGWSWPSLNAYVNDWFDSVQNGDSQEFNRLRALPWEWLLVRVALLAGVLLLAAWVARRRAPGRFGTQAAVLVIPLAVFLGIAAFSNTPMMFPFVSPRFELYYTPLYQSLMVEYPLVLLYLTYGIPALLFGLSVGRRRGRQGLNTALGLTAAAGCLFAFLWVWPANQAYLTQTGLLTTVSLAGLGCFLLLLQVVRRRVEAEQDAVALPPSDTPGIENAPTEPAPPPVVSPRERKLLFVLVAVLFIAAAVRQIGRPLPTTRPAPASAAGPGSGPIETTSDGWTVHRLPDGQGEFAIPPEWQAARDYKKAFPKAVGEFFRVGEKRAIIPILLVSPEVLPPGGIMQLIERFRETNRQVEGLDFRETSLTREGLGFPGAVLWEYRLTILDAQRRKCGAVGLSLLAALPRGPVLVFEIIGAEADAPLLRSDLVRLAARLGASYPEVHSSK